MTVRVAGAVAALVLLLWAVRSRRRGRSSRGELLSWFALGSVLLLLSTVPAVTGVLADTLRLNNRLFAVLVTAVTGLAVLRQFDRRRLRAVEERMGTLVQNLAVREYERSVEATANLSTVAIVIPAYNEADAIEEVLRELPGTVCGLVVEPIVVVDGADDDTEHVARRAGYLAVIHPINRGQGDALRTGFRVALARGATVIVTMDADGQHDPAELEDLIGPVVRDEADYVQGSRFKGSYDDAGGARHLGIHIFTWVINLLGRASITDCTNGYRAIRGERLAALRLEEDRFSAPELIMETAKQGLRILEVPTHIRSRTHGDSKKPPRLGYPVGFLFAILRVWLR